MIFMELESRRKSPTLATNTGSEMVVVVDGLEINIVVCDVSAVEVILIDCEQQMGSQCYDIEQPSGCE